jgi:hypothetical protein
LNNETKRKNEDNFKSKLKRKRKYSSDDSADSEKLRQEEAKKLEE